jgi:hypothetical protein
MMMRGLVIVGLPYRGCGTRERRAVNHSAGSCVDVPMALSDLRLGFACKERWEDMVGDDRVRACKGCARTVFNLSAMTRDAAEAVLATRGLTPCVRFYRRPDGTVMTTDCPTSTRREGRRLAVVASSLAAGTALAIASPARADVPPADSTTDAPGPAADPAAATPAPAEPLGVDDPPLMGVPIEMGIIEVEDRKRPALAWSTWGRLGVGMESQQPSAIARSLTPPMAESSSMWEAAAGADLTFRVALDGNLRLGAWGEVRTSSDPVVGAELVLEHLPPSPDSSRIAGSGSLVLRAGANGHVVTGALGIGYLGSWPSHAPWLPWARHVVGARVVASINRSTDDPREWSATIGLEVDPIGAVHAVFDLVTKK